MVQDLFDNMPVTNIRSEVHFASARMRSMSSHGNAPQPATLASDHVIAESRLVLDTVPQSLPQIRGFCDAPGALGQDIVVTTHNPSCRPGSICDLSWALSGDLGALLGLLGGLISPGALLGASRGVLGSLLGLKAQKVPRAPKGVF
eukprot:8375487-Pyramimonas_sp.AAC.1